MRYEIDEKNEIVDFYITDDYGKEHHAAMSFKEAEAWLTDILWYIRNPMGPSISIKLTDSENV